MPLADPLEALAGLVGLVLGHVVEKLFEFFERALAVFQAGDEALFDEAINERLELQAGGVEGKASAGFPLNGAEAFQGAESETDGSEADAHTVGDFLHGERGCGAEKESVDLTVGTGIPKEVGQLGEDLDEATLEADLCFSFRRLGNRFHCE